MSDLYSNDEVRKKAESLVEREVYYCVSYLVSQIAQGGYEACKLLDIDYEDELLPLLETVDYEEAALRYIDDGMDADDLRDYLDDQCADYDAEVEEELDEEGNVEVEAVVGSTHDELKLLARAAAEEQGYEDFCSDMRLDPDRNDVYEHWIVSSWFARKLREKGHPVGELLGLTIWGRGTTGQSISMDGSILEIARDCLES